MQKCKCGNIMGFHIGEVNISVLSSDLDNVLIWQDDLNGWQDYDKTHDYSLETWQGYFGQPFEISSKSKTNKLK
jgi:hypothetical protein